MERLLNALVGESASRRRARAFASASSENAMNDTEVEIELEDSPAMPMEIPGMGGNVGMINLSDMMGKAFGKQNLKRRKLKVPDAWDKLVDEESEKRMDQDDVARVALAECRDQRDRLPRRDRQDRGVATCAAARSAAKACSATCCR